jgi:hypothetical protein
MIFYPANSKSTPDNRDFCGTKWRKNLYVQQAARPLGITPLVRGVTGAGLITNAINSKPAAGIGRNPGPAAGAGFAGKSAAALSLSYWLGFWNRLSF